MVDPAEISQSCPPSSKLIFILLSKINNHQVEPLLFLHCGSLDTTVRKVFFRLLLLADFTDPVYIRLSYLCL